MNKLTEFEQFVIEQKGTEKPFSGEFNQHNKQGTYHCKKCDAPLYHSSHKFESGCGWPAFDGEIEGAVIRVPDADGRRTEIVCHQCGGHLGHVFEGEMLTDNNIRHCVNSVSLAFSAKDEQQNTSVTKLELATIGGGCFWCIESLFLSLDGVQSVTSGYAGGDPDRADYRSVCQGNTGHAEVVQIEFSPSDISYQDILTIFFDAHDPTSLNRQGNDIGSQYRSVIFTHSPLQQQIAGELIASIDNSGVWHKPLVTELVAYESFYPAEAYHHDYYAKNVTENRYCQLVIGPKLAMLKSKYANKLK